MEVSFPRLLSPVQSRRLAHWIRKLGVPLVSVNVLQNNKLLGHCRKWNTISRSSSPYCIHFTDNTNFFFGGGGVWILRFCQSDFIAWEDCDGSEMVRKNRRCLMEVLRIISEILRVANGSVAIRTGCHPNTSQQHCLWSSFLRPYRLMELPVANYCNTCHW